MKKTFLLLPLFLICNSLQAQFDGGVFKTKVGQQIPNIEMTSLSDEHFHLSDFRDQVVLLVLFGTRCRPCLRELPEINRQIISKHKNNKLKVILVGSADNHDQLLAFKNKKGYEAIFVADPEQRIFDHFAEHSIPRNILINPEGKIIFQA